MNMTKKILLSMVSGVLLALAFPKFDLFWLAWFALVPFLWALHQSRDWRAAVGCALIFGATFFGIYFSWFTSLYRFVGIWIALGWVSLALFQASYLIIFVIGYRFLAARLKIDEGDYSPVKLIVFVVMAALFWSLVEILRSFGPLGLTFGDIGYSQVTLLPLIQIARFTSVYGVSFLLFLFNLSLVIIIQNRRKWQPLLLAVLAMLAVFLYGSLVLVAAPAVSPEQPATQKILIVQPNIDQKDKLNPGRMRWALKIMKDMTDQQRANRPEIIFWPESAIFTYLLHDRALLQQVKEVAVSAHAWLVLGTPIYENGKAYNSMLAISPAGKVVDRYDKTHLVPFGEYLPLRPLLYPILKGVGYYDNVYALPTRARDFSIGKQRVAASICFESLFPRIIKQRVGEGADFILLLTNDAWFGASSLPYAHLNASVFRAIENRKYFVQVGNTGISAVIDPYGRVLKKTALNQREVLSFDLPNLRLDKWR
jgi:apolipoprotein N-acyltransferase